MVSALALAVVLAAPPASPAADATLRVSRACAAAPMVQRSLPAKGSVIDLLRQAARVDAGSGGFVTAIEDLRSGAPDGRREDWFYFINGVLAPVGPAQYRPAPGDHIWWDFHPWSESFHVGALIGAFPRPFAGGYGGKAAPTRILFTGGFDDAAETLVALLREKGASDTAAEALSPERTLDVEKHALLLLGPWSDLSRNTGAAAIHRDAERTGCLVEFGPAGASGRDWSGKPGPPQPSAGAILALKLGARPGAALFLVTGTGAAETRAASDLLTKRPETVLGLAGLMLVGGRVVPLPAHQGSTTNGHE